MYSLNKLNTKQNRRGITQGSAPCPPQTPLELRRPQLLLPRRRRLQKCAAVAVAVAVVIVSNISFIDVLKLLLLPQQQPQQLVLLPLLLLLLLLLQQRPCMRGPSPGSPSRLMLSFCT